MLKGRKITEVTYNNKYKLHFYKVPFLNIYTGIVYRNSNKIYTVVSKSLHEAHSRILKDLQIII